MPNVYNKIIAALIMSLVICYSVGVDVTFSIIPIPNFALALNRSIGLIWIFLGPALAVSATVLVTYLAPTGRQAWGRLFLMNGLVCLTLPLVGIVFIAFFGPHMEMEHGNATDTAVDFMVMLAGIEIEGVIIGIIFLISAYFTLRSTARILPVSKQPLGS